MRKKTIALALIVAIYCALWCWCAQHPAQGPPPPKPDSDVAHRYMNEEKPQQWEGFRKENK